MAGARAFHNAPLEDTLAALADDESGYLALAAHLKASVGLHLPPTPKNRTLMASRMRSVCREFAVGSYREILSRMLAGDVPLAKAVVGSMTTHTTQFFRESAHFELLARELGRLLERRRADGSFELRFWCAAASTGEEAYSMAITVLEQLAAANVWREPWRLRFLATDIDEGVLLRGARGVYDETAVADVPPHLLGRYFERYAGAGSSDGAFRLVSSVRGLVTFAPFNLVDAIYPFQGRFDVIFCRNVFIYFDDDDVAGTLARMENVLAPGGLLFLGHSESLVKSRALLLPRAPAVYERAGDDQGGGGGGGS